MMSVALGVKPSVVLVASLLPLSVGISHALLQAPPCTFRLCVRMGQCGVGLPFGGTLLCCRRLAGAGWIDTVAE
jgi:hypothetical protein